VVTRATTIALVATVRDEMPGLREWLCAIDRQTQMPDEVIVVDGGSTDGTWQCLQEWATTSGATVLQTPGANISEGRNHAIANAQSEIIVVTDAGTQAAADWLECLAMAFTDDRIDVASGFFVPEHTSAWDRALAATTLPDAVEIDPATFLPSSRSVAFRRTWWEGGVRYPEWLDYCEDLVFDLALKRAGARFRFVPSASVAFRVRPSVGSYARQYYRYARGDGKAGLFPKRHALRYLTYACALLVTLRQRPRELLLATILGGLYLRAPLLRLWHRDRSRKLSLHSSALLVPLLPVLRGVGDVAKMVGYPAGLYWRWRRSGAIGWKTAWRRVSPSGVVWRPSGPTTRSPRPTSLPDA
jgi:glycosyltransferase involved in cell wall biosynthesis